MKKVIIGLTFLIITIMASSAIAQTNALITGNNLTGIAINTKLDGSLHNFISFIDPLAGVPYRYYWSDSEDQLTANAAAQLSLLLSAKKLNRNIVVSWIVDNNDAIFRKVTKVELQ